MSGFDELFMWRVPASQISGPAWRGIVAAPSGPAGAHVTLTMPQQYHPETGWYCLVPRRFRREPATVSVPRAARLLRAAAWSDEAEEDFLGLAMGFYDEQQRMLPRIVGSISFPAPVEVLPDGPAAFRRQVRRFVRAADCILDGCCVLSASEDARAAERIAGALADPALHAALPSARRAEVRTCVVRLHLHLLGV